jgi:uncharacterized protein YjbJ (UPF0337 family)
MNRDRMSGQWKQLIGRARERWGKLIHDRLAVAAGRHDRLAGKLQERSGLAREEAERHLVAWRRRVKDYLFNSDDR